MNTRKRDYLSFYFLLGYSIRIKLRVVPHFSSGIVEQAKRERACRVFSREVIFTRARVSLALLSLRKNGGLLVVYIRIPKMTLFWFQSNSIIMEQVPVSNIIM